MSSNSRRLRFGHTVLDDRAFVAPGLVDATTWTYSFWFYPEQNPTGHYRSILHRVCPPVGPPTQSHARAVGDAGR